MLKSKTSSFARLPLHPFTLAAYPAVALLAQNLREVEAWVVFRPLVASLLLAAAVYALAFLWLRSWRRAALLASFLLLLFFTYGHAYALLRAVPALAPVLGRHRYLAPLYLIVAAVGCWWIVARMRALPAWTQVLNLGTAVMLAISLGQIGLSSLPTPARSASLSDSRLSLDANAPKPDIYYIILDMYARGDVIAQDFDYNNRAFLDALKQAGFYVAECSRSNYGETELSLASSLNLNYLDQFARDYTPGSSGERQLPALIKHSALRAKLEAIGYRTVAFETGYYWSQWMDADVYLAPTQSNQVLSQFRPFETLFIKTTAAVLWVDARAKTAQAEMGSVDFPFADHIRREQFLLDKLPSLSSLSGPKLVFAHILIPHHPQIFTASGEIQTDLNYYSNGDRPVNDEYFKKGYRGQVEFISKRILDIVKSIQAQSKTPPVIILQGDHGVKPPTRHAILNAYYLPGGEDALYPTISPVNSFRVALNTLFQANLPLLPDRSFDLNKGQHRFDAVPETMPDCQSE